MTLAPGWRKVEMTAEAIRSTAASFESSNPQLAAALNQLLQSGQFQAIQLYAIDYDGDKAIGNLNAASFLIGPFDLDATASLLASQLKVAGATEVQASHVALPAGDSVLMSYQLVVGVGSAARTVTGHAYVLLRDRRGYQVTFTCSGPDPTACLKQGDEMIRTYQIGG
jgi:hypothetical protein